MTAHFWGAGEGSGLGGGVVSPGRGFSGSTTMLGSTTGGGTMDFGLGIVSGCFWIPGSIFDGGGGGASWGVCEGGG